MKLSTGLLLTAANGGLAVTAPAVVPGKWSMIFGVVQLVLQVVIQVLAQQSPPSSTLPPVQPASRPFSQQ